MHIKLNSTFVNVKKLKLADFKATQKQLTMYYIGYRISYEEVKHCTEYHAFKMGGDRLKMERPNFPEFSKLQCSNVLSGVCLVWKNIDYTLSSVE